MKRKVLIVLLVVLMSVSAGISLYRTVINPPAQETLVVKEDNLNNINLLHDFWDRSWLSLLLLVISFVTDGVYKNKESRAIKGDDE